MRVTKGSITAFLDAFVPRLMVAPVREKPWRLVWLGGMIVVRDQNASVWILPYIRKEFVSICIILLCLSCQRLCGAGEISWFQLTDEIGVFVHQGQSSQRDSFLRR